MNGKMIMDFIAWTIIAAIIVLVVMNASKFQTALKPITGFWLSETAMFTGSGYQCPPGSRMVSGQGCV